MCKVTEVIQHYEALYVGLLYVGLGLYPEATK